MNDVAADTAQYSCRIGGKLFQVLRFSALEEISQLSRYNLTLWSDDPAVAVDTMVRKDAEVTLTWAGKKKQFFGIVASFSQTGAGLPGAGGVETPWGEYLVDIVPTLFLLSQKTNCRIFQNLSADQIIKKVLDERGMAGKYDPRLKACPPREYCVQYRENDLAFISRLMEEEGIFYYFTHDGQEMMVLGDDAGDYGTCTPESEAEYKTGSGRLSTAKEYISSLTYNANVHIGKVSFKDFDYRDPKKPLKVDESGAANTDLEIYDYHPDRYRDDSRGRQLAKVVVEAQETWKKTLAMHGSWRSATAGCKVTLSKAYRSDLNGDWLIVQVRHNATQLADTGIDYSVSLYAIPADTAFRPIIRTPKPVLNPQTARVVGPPDSRIHMDELGRAKVQFHWDLEGKKNDKSSCWIRVAQPYAGFEEDRSKRHGFQWHPLVGDEVVVDFLEGDPDRPLIVGSVYNAVNRPIVKPDELIRSRILTPYQHQLLMDDKNASIALNTGGVQRLVMNDLKTPEDEAKGKVTLATSKGEVLVMEDLSDDLGNMIVLQTKDEHRIVMSEKDQKRGIALETNHGHHLILVDSLEKIQAGTQNKHYLVLDDTKRHIFMLTTDGHRLELDDENRKITITSASGHAILIDDGSDQIEIADASRKHFFRIDARQSQITVSTSGSVGISAGGSVSISGSSISLSAKGDVSVTAKNFTVDASADSKIAAGSDAKMDAGGTCRVSGSKGILKGTNVEVAGSATVKIKGGADVTSESGGTNTIKGALVKIN